MILAIKTATDRDRLPGVLPVGLDPIPDGADDLGAIAVAAEDADPDGVVVGLLDVIGWMNDDGTPLPRSTASRAAWDTKDVPRRLRMLDRGRRAVDRRERVTPGAVAFARAAVRSWPG
ncbi:hypothetical protein LRC484719_02270 [Mycobacterium riyadhense]